MDDNNNIEKKIKETFDGLNKSAPDNLWGNLSNKLNDTDKNIEEKIRSVFENMNKTAPSNLWGTVNKQLNIDKVWQRISAELDRGPVYYWRNVASLATFLIVLMVGGIYLNDKKTTPIISKIEFAQKQRINETESHETANSFIKEPKSKKQDLIVKETANEKTINASVSNVNNFKLLKNKDLVENTSKKMNSAQVGQIEVHLSKISSKIKKEEHNNTVNTVPVTSPSVSSIVLSPIKLSLPNVYSPDSELMASSITHNIVPDSLIKKKEILYRSKRFELGITYSYNNTWIINNETQRSFDQYSLINTSPAFASSYGVMANYNFSKSSGLTAEFYVNSQCRQQYSEFTQGEYASRTIEFNYTKLTLMYQLSIPQSYYRKIPSKYTIRAGFYGAYLMNYRDSYNKNIDAGTSNYTSTDYGFKLAIGQEKRFGNLIIGYGANTEYGFQNNFAGNKQMPSGFNITKNANIGAYICLKYSFGK